MRFQNLLIVVAVGAVIFSGSAQAAITVVNSAAALGANTQAITFDTPDSATLAAVQANFGVSVQSAEAGAAPFIASSGNYSGIGFLASRALGNTINGLISDVSQAPNYSGSTLRAFDILFSAPVSAFGLTVQGWGGDLDHRFTFYNNANQSLGSLTFAAAGLVSSDTSPNGFAGFQSDTAIARVRVTPSEASQDFVAFDNFTFVRASAGGVPEPLAWMLMVMGFGGAGALLRRQRASATHRIEA